jgi:hypothetical protein
MASPLYRTAHQRLRDYLLARLVPGAPCPQVFADGTVCGKPMYRTQPLDLGHNSTGGYLGIVHAACNRREGGIRGNRSPKRKGKPDNRRQGKGRRW